MQVHSVTNKDLKAVDDEIKRAEEVHRSSHRMDHWEGERWCKSWSLLHSNFETTISPSSLSVVIDLIRARRFRQAWNNLNEYFSATIGGRESCSAMLEILTTAVWNGTDFKINLISFWDYFIKILPYLKNKFNCIKCMCCYKMISDRIILIKLLKILIYQKRFQLQDISLFTFVFRR